MLFSKASSGLGEDNQRPQPSRCGPRPLRELRVAYHSLATRLHPGPALHISPWAHRREERSVAADGSFLGEGTVLSHTAAPWSPAGSSEGCQLVRPRGDAWAPTLQGSHGGCPLSFCDPLTGIFLRFLPVLCFSLMAALPATVPSCTHAQADRHMHTHTRTHEHTHVHTPLLPTQPAPASSDALTPPPSPAHMLTDPAMPTLGAMYLSIACSTCSSPLHHHKLIP